MNKVIHYIGLDVHKESIAVSIAPQHSTEVRRYGIIGGSLDAVDKLVKKLSRDGVELRFIYEAGPCGLVYDFIWQMIFQYSAHATPACDFNVDFVGWRRHCQRPGTDVLSHTRAIAECFRL